MSEDIEITLTGPFTPLELATLVDLIRRFDETSGRHFEMFVNDTGHTLDNAKAIVHRLFPERPGRKTTFSVHRKQ
jgi:hypothetical protein